MPDRATFVNWAVPWAVEASRRTGVPWQTIVAQWGFETGWGTSNLFRNHHNFAGVKRGKATAGMPVAPGGSFRSYPDYEAGLEDWVRVMFLRYYDKVRAAGDVQAACRALGESPWDARHYRGGKDTNPPGHALLAQLPTVAKLAPIGGRIDLVPVV
jgi:flagellum-specific peptidoglycan hydrolase FlgJ